MKKLLIALLMAGVLGGAVYGAAASLGGVDSANLGTSTAVVGTCDTDGVDVQVTQVGTEITSVIVSDIGGPVADSCDGKVVAVQLTGGTSTSAQATLPVVVGANTLTLVPDDNGDGGATSGAAGAKHVAGDLTGETVVISEVVDNTGAAILVGP